MNGLRLCCPRALFGTCPASFAVIALSPTAKNISMIKCFRVFFEVIAFVCIGSQFVAVRTLLPSYHRIDADAASAGAHEVGEASIMRSGHPTSRRGITEGWDVSLPPQRPEWFFEGQPKHIPDFDCSSRAAPYARRDEPLRCGTEEAPQCWNPGHTHNPAVAQTGQATDPAGAAFIGANRIFARLVLHQVRARDRSAAAPKRRTGSPRNLNPVSIPVPDAGSEFTPGSDWPLTTAQAASSGPLLAPIETLLTELAWRRLRSLAAKKRTG
jgi:hypothetical protein